MKDEKETKDNMEIITFVREGIKDDIKSVEENCGSLWIECINGDVYCVNVFKTEGE